MSHASPTPITLLDFSLALEQALQPKHTFDLKYATTNEMNNHPLLALCKREEGLLLQVKGKSPLDCVVVDSKLFAGHKYRCNYFVDPGDYDWIQISCAGTHHKHYSLYSIPFAMQIISEWLTKEEVYVVSNACISWPYATDTPSRERYILECVKQAVLVWERSS